MTSLLKTAKNSKQYELSGRTGNQPAQAIPNDRRSNIQDWRAAGLLKPSAIKPLITTIEKHLVIKAMGQLNPEDNAALKENLKTILG